MKPTTRLDAAAPDDDFLRPLSPATAGAAFEAAHDDDFTPLPPGARLGAYEVIDLIARGGMGAVYRGRRADDAFDKYVAIKVMTSTAESNEARARFRRERAILAALEHPNIARLLDGGVGPRGELYLVMDLINGPSLDVFCAVETPTLDARLDLFEAVCEGVLCAHHRLVIHGDLTPRNVLVAPDGAPRVIDFGVARPTARNSGQTLTGAGGRPMTPGYASPEQIRGEPLTIATDVFSLGVLLYELLTGQRPFPTDGRPRYAIERDVCESYPSPASQAASAPDRARLRGDLDAIIAAALARHPADRYASVERLLDDIRRHRRGEAVRAQRATWSYRTRVFVRRRRAHLAVATAMLAVLLGSLAAVTMSMTQWRRAAEDAQRASARASGALAFYEDLLAAAHPYRTGEPVTLNDLLLRAEAKLTAGSTPPGAEAGVRLALAQAHANLMQWSAAAGHAARATTLFRAVPSPTRADEAGLASALTVLGRAHTQLDWPGAAAYQREGLAVRRRLFGPEDPRVAESLGCLGYALSTGGPGVRDEAEACYLEALAMLDRLGAGQSPDAARLTMSLGFMHHRTGRSDEAERRYRAALAIYDAQPETIDLYELATRRLLAQVLEATGRLDEAERCWASCRAHIPTDLDPIRAESAAAQLASLRRRLDQGR